MVVILRLMTSLVIILMSLVGSIIIGSHSIENIDFVYLFMAFFLTYLSVYQGGYLSLYKEGKKVKTFVLFFLIPHFIAYFRLFFF